MKMNRLVLFFIAFSMCALITSALEFKGVGLVVEMAGKAQVVRMEPSEQNDLTAMSDVFLGDTIVTGEDGKVKILFSDEKTSFSIGSDSEVTIDEYIYNPQEGQRKSTADLKKGVMKVLVKEGDQTDARIKTSTAVIGVKGTHFFAQTFSPRKSRFTMIEGLAWVRNRDERIKKEVDLETGMFLDIIEGAEPGTPQVSQKEDLDQLFNATSVPADSMETLSPELPPAPEGPAEGPAPLPEIEVPSVSQDIIVEPPFAEPPVDNPEYPEHPIYPPYEP